MSIPGAGGTEEPQDLDESLARTLAPDLEIQHLLGQGTTSRVYLARDVALDKLVTVKVLKPEAAALPETRARFEREARAAANIIHPNVSTVYRFGLLPDGKPFLVMQYVRGRTLKDRLAAEGPLGIGETRRILADIASGLEAAHAQGVIHRDIRPDNILLEEMSGRALLTDFGIAAVNEAWTHGHPTKLTATGQILGDPRYVSPEQFAGGHVDEFTDVYSLAIVAYEMLTGKLPLADLDRRAAQTARLMGEPVELPDSIADGDPLLADLLGRCLAARPNGRPKARTLARRLRPRSDPDPDPDPRPPLPPLPVWVKRGWRALNRRRVPQWVAAVGAAGVFVLAVVADVPDVSKPLYFSTLATVIASIVGAGILAWFHGERGEQRFHALELWLLGIVVIVWLASMVVILG